MSDRTALPLARRAGGEMHYARAVEEVYLAIAVDGAGTSMPARIELRSRNDSIANACDRSGSDDICTRVFTHACERVRLRVCACVYLD